MSGVLAIISAIVLSLAGARMVLSPFGSGIDPGAPFLQRSTTQVEAFKLLWFVGWFGYLNWVIFLANLIPALPLDGGRILRAVLSRSSVGITRDNPYPQWTARGFAVVLAIAGLFKTFNSLSDGLTLFCLAFLIELIVRSESRMMEDGGFFEDGVFGYDFSEGYTSLESSAAKVRPYKESALKRWRRRRSELRRQRRVAREAAEEQRMDEILEKLHIQGKASLDRRGTPLPRPGQRQAPEPLACPRLTGSERPSPEARSCSTLRWELASSPEGSTSPATTPPSG